jgi:hypothetical protein
VENVEFGDETTKSGWLALIAVILPELTAVETNARSCGQMHFLQQFDVARVMA